MRRKLAEGALPDGNADVLLVEVHLRHTAGTNLGTITKH
jgi:hypothetical protein